MHRLGAFLLMAFAVVAFVGIFFFVPMGSSWG